MKKDKWIFFDIDGTLLYAKGAGRKAFQEAFKDALGWDQGVEHINFYGATDLDVFRRIAADRGEISTPEMEKAFFGKLGERLDGYLEQTPPELLPSVNKLIPILAQDWNLGVITGNIAQTAKSKLKYAGLLKYFDERGFGFGCDHHDRIEIANLALIRAGNPEKKVSIGDTPKDIEAANKNGMVSIAVATGMFDCKALKAAGADFVFEDFSDTEKLLDVLKNI